MNASPQLPALRGVLTMDEPMSRHTTWRVGGPADQFYQPVDADDLAGFVSSVATELPVFWVGLGSNILVRDGGVRGVVVCTAHVLNECDFIAPDVLRVGAGVACARVAKFAAGRGLGGAEFLIGIPGTMGGALAMNAGAFGGETWHLVRAVETMDRYGRRRWRDKSEFHVGYRSVSLAANEWFLRADLTLVAPGDAEVTMATVKRLLQRRAESQPVGQPSCGSVFRNPPGDYAARLIEACGLKGACIGGAQVSEKHANFIVNLGNASALDIERLIEHVSSKVTLVHGLQLECEVKIIGDRQARPTGVADHA